MIDRRKLLVGDQGWSPADESPSAWWYAAPEYLTLSGSDVTVWADRTKNNNYVENALGGNPTWSAAGWSSGHGAIVFAGGQTLTRTTGLLGSSFSGSQAFTVLATLFVSSAARSLTLCSWDDGVVTARSNVYFADDGLGTSELTAYKRTDDASTSVTAQASTQAIVPGAKARVAWVYTGTAISTYVDGRIALNASAVLMGPATFTRFRMGDGPEAADDSFIGSVAETVLFNRALPLATISQYYAYSLAEFG